jgi:UDP-glucuronate decarboxylase
MKDLRQRVLVTGGAGFPGSHLCERLLVAGCQVLCADNFYTGRLQNVVISSITRVSSSSATTSRPASSIHYQFDPVQTTKTSVHGAINMLGLAKRVKARILQASTSEVYGDPEIHPQREDYWGRVNPDPNEVVLRRGQTLCRDAVLRLPPPARPRYQGSAHLQHVRSALTGASCRTSSCRH